MGQKGQSYYGQRGEFCLAKRVKVEWLFHRATYTQEDDLIEYVARVYAYRGREQEFLDRYADYDKVLRKFQMMQGFVNTFEEWWDLK